MKNQPLICIHFKDPFEMFRDFECSRKELKFYVWISTNINPTLEEFFVL